MFLFLVGDFLIYCCWINIMKNFQRKYKKVGLSNKKVKRVFNVHTQNAFIVSWILFCCKRIRDCQIFYFGKVTLQIALQKMNQGTMRCSVSRENWKKDFHFRCLLHLIQNYTLFRIKIKLKKDFHFRCLLFLWWGRFRPLLHRLCPVASFPLFPEMRN